MKQCKCCGETKPLDEYYLQGKERKTHMSTCKVCVRKRSQERTQRLLLDAAWVEKELERQRIKQRKKNAKIPYEQKKTHIRTYVEKYPEKRKAQHAVQQALRNGSLKKEPCSVCGNPNSEGHHEDYSKPLDVMWLCPKHHAERHVEIRRIQRMMRLNPPRPQENDPLTTAP